MRDKLEANGQNFDQVCKLALRLGFPDGAMPIVINDEGDMFLILQVEGDVVTGVKLERGDLYECSAELLVQSRKENPDFKTWSEGAKS